MYCKETQTNLGSRLKSWSFDINNRDKYKKIYILYSQSFLLEVEPQWLPFKFKHFPIFVPNISKQTRMPKLGYCYTFAKYF